MKKKVLFVCIGNICRSPMAEAMARKYGSDILEPSSAGLMPALMNTPFTRTVLTEKNVELGEHLPRRFRDADLRDYDLIVNMSGSPLPRNLGIPVEDWNVDDPMGKTEDDFRKTRETIEMLVMRLILRARMGKI
jgi:arsenate reductase (thioredoxin)